MSDSELFEQGPEEDLDRRYVNEDEVEDEVNEDEVNEDEVNEDEEDEDEVDGKELVDYAYNEEGDKQWEKEAIDHQWDEEEEAGGVDYAGMGGEPPFVLEGEKPNDIVENVVNDAAEEHCETTEEAGKEGEAAEEGGVEGGTEEEAGNVEEIAEFFKCSGYDQVFAKSIATYYSTAMEDIFLIVAIIEASAKRLNKAKNEKLPEDFKMMFRVLFTELNPAIKKAHMRLKPYVEKYKAIGSAIGSAMPPPAMPLPSGSSSGSPAAPPSGGKRRPMRWTYTGGFVKQKENTTPENANPKDDSDQ